MSNTGLVRAVCSGCVHRAKFVKEYEHKGPKTGKEDRRGSYWMYHRRGTSRYGYVSQDSSMFVVEPMMVPKLMVPTNLPNFKLKAYVSKRLPVNEEPARTPGEYLDSLLLLKS